MAYDVKELELRKRYFLESLIWRHLDRPKLLLTYVQDPVFNLNPTEVYFLEYLHQKGLSFTLRPRYDPSSFIHLTVRLGPTEQLVRLEVYQGIAVTSVFITERNEFAEELKGWLDRNLGSEHFAAHNYVATRRFVNYPYILPVDSNLITQVLTKQEKLPKDVRGLKLFFNLSAKERHFLNKLENALTECALDDPDPIYIQVYPRQTDTGSIEIVANNSEERQPARIFISGYHPIAYQMITENSKLGEQLHLCLDSALGKENFDCESSRLRGKYLSLIYNVRYSLDLLDSFEDDDEDE